MGFLLERILPDDLLAFSKHFAIVGWQPGGTLAPLDFAILFLGHTVKWPPAVRHMAALVRQDRALILSERRYLHGSDGLVRLYRAVIEWCAGAQRGAMFARMNRGLQDAQTGLAVNGQHLGLLERVVPSSPAKRARTHVQGIKQADKPMRGDSDRPITVHMGPALAPHLLHAEGSPQDSRARSLVAAILDKAAEEPWRWPASDAEVPSLADQWLAATRSVRTLQIQGAATKAIGFPGGKNPSHAYLAKHFVRAVLLQVEETFPMALASTALPRAHEWCPHQSNLMAELGAMSVAMRSSSSGLIGTRNSPKSAAKTQIETKTEPTRNAGLRRSRARRSPRIFLRSAAAAVRMVVLSVFIRQSSV
jgi:hypothetical protein